MFGYIILSISLIFITLVFLLFNVVIYHYYTDPYDMHKALEELMEYCQKYQSDIRQLKDIKNQMESCPIIGDYVSPIEVFSPCAKLYVLIAGDANGKPRLFAFKCNEGYSIADYRNLRDSNKRFKKYALKHSISSDELATILNEMEKKNYNNELEEKQRYTIYNHFKK